MREMRSEWVTQTHVWASDVDPAHLEQARRETQLTLLNRRSTPTEPRPGSKAFLNSLMYTTARLPTRITSNMPAHSVHLTTSTLTFNIVLM